jgi:hypothetical protein
MSVDCWYVGVVGGRALGFDAAADSFEFVHAQRAAADASCRSCHDDADLSDRREREAAPGILGIAGLA